MTCQIEDCAEVSVGRGLCRKHYTRWSRYGDPSVVVQPNQRRRAARKPRAPKDPVSCTAEGCLNSRSKALGLCTKHYQRFRKHGNTVDPLGVGSFKHGHAANSGRSAEYSSWQAMTGRVRNPSSTSFRWYGGAGITICERWGSFENFYADMGPRPKGTTLDRYPNKTGNYEPGNVRWATWAEQSRNKTVTRNVTIDGETRCLKDWAGVSGVSYETVCARLKRGWSERDAIFCPPIPRAQRRWNPTRQEVEE